MELTVIGCGPAYSRKRGSTGSCYLISTAGTPATRIVLDLGHGTFANLGAELDPAGLDAVVVSHLHPDHFIDLVPLRHYLRYECDPPARMRVIAPAALGERLDALHDDPGFTAGSLDAEPLQAGAGTSVGHFTIETVPVTHGGDARAIRVSDATRSGAPGLVYSGDCGRATDLDALIRAGDTLLIEVSYGADEVPEGALHLEVRSVAALAASTGVGQLILVHLMDGHDPDATVQAARALYDGPVVLAAPGDRLGV